MFARLSLCSLSVAMGLAAVAVASCLMANQAYGQQQEGVLLNRIMHPDMDLHFDGFDRKFGTTASAGNKKANVHAFNLGTPIALRAGDGTYHPHTFANGKMAYGTADFSTKPAAQGIQAAAMVDRGYAAKGVETKYDRAAGRSMPIRSYATADKPYLVPGKRQDTIDELRLQKDLTIDQVRELLNKSK